MPSLFAILGIKKIYKHNKGIFKILQNKKWPELARLGEHACTKKLKKGQGEAFFTPISSPTFKKCSSYGKAWF